MILRDANVLIHALAIEHGCEWISTVANYGRSRGLRWRRPLA